MITKTEKIQKIRQDMRQWRKHLPSLQCQHTAREATERLINHPLFLKSQHIACYMPVRNEVDTSLLIEKIWQAGKQCYLPAIDPVRPGTMRFHLYKRHDKLINNIFFIPEPDCHARTIPPWALNLVITPLLAFDQAGNRLGSGCGYYDRVFANIHSWASAPMLCGFAYQQQQLDDLPSQSWDVPMRYIATNQEVITAQPRN